MAGSLTSIFLMTLLFVASVVCIFGPLTVLGVMFWHWHKELRDTARLRLARSTQIR